MSRILVAAFALVLGALVAHNVVWAVRNQTDNQCAYTVCIGPRAMDDMARRNRHPVVNGRVSVYFWLREHLAGATLIIPPWLELGQWELRHITRARVQVRGERLLIANASAEALTRQARSTRQWLAKRKGKRGTYRPVHLILAEASYPDDAYVVAETDEKHGPVFILRASHYQRVVAP